MITIPVICESSFKGVIGRESKTYFDEMLLKWVAMQLRILDLMPKSELVGVWIFKAGNVSFYFCKFAQKKLVLHTALLIPRLLFFAGRPSPFWGQHLKAFAKLIKMDVAVWHHCAPGWIGTSHNEYCASINKVACCCHSNPAWTSNRWTQICLHFWLCCCQLALMKLFYSFSSPLSDFSCHTRTSNLNLIWKHRSTREACFSQFLETDQVFQESMHCHANRGSESSRNKEI